MSATVVSIHPAELLPQAMADLPPPAFFRGLQWDFSQWLSRLERTLRWLDRNQIEVISFACSSFKGGRVWVRHSARVHQLLGEKAVSVGFRGGALGRKETFSSTDPATGTTIVWEEERSARA